MLYIFLPLILAFRNNNYNFLRLLVCTCKTREKEVLLVIRLLEKKLLKNEIIKTENCA